VSGDAHHEPAVHNARCCTRAATSSPPHQTRQGMINRSGVLSKIIAYSLRASTPGQEDKEIVSKK